MSAFLGSLKFACTVVAQIPPPWGDFEPNKETLAQFIAEVGFSLAIWLFCTRYFFGPPIFNRLMARLGGDCVLAVPFSLAQKSSWRTSISENQTPTYAPLPKGSCLYYHMAIDASKAFPNQRNLRAEVVEWQTLGKQPPLRGEWAGMGPILELFGSSLIYSTLIGAIMRVIKVYFVTRLMSPSCSGSGAKSSPKMMLPWIGLLSFLVATAVVAGGDLKVLPQAIVAISEPIIWLNSRCNCLPRYTQWHWCLASLLQ